jgi:phosphoribosyl 1,2-cyclic phosphodiesterase
MSTFCTICSGSSGNSSYVACRDTHILVDAGTTLKAISRALDNANARIDEISAVLVTHEHTDHIKGLLPLLRKTKARVYMSAGTAQSMQDKGMQMPEDLFTFDEGDEFSVGSLFVRPFSTDHDTPHSVGYVIDTADNKRVAIATDLGRVQQKTLDAMQGADIALVETNHDVQMLMAGPYPRFLKRRVSGIHGHLSNEDGALLIGELAKSGTRHFMLGHLSAQNNRASLAVAAVIRKLEESGMTERDCALEVAPRYEPGPVYRL